MRRLRIPALAVAACLAAALALAAVAGAATVATPRTITVDGTGIVTSVPDQAEFSFGVSTTASSARAALSQNAARMTRVIAALKAQGIAPADIRTDQISLTPNTNEAGTSVVSYTATNSVSATTKSIARAGAIIDAAVKAGANLVGGPSLTPSDQHLLERQALRAAMADARARAQVIATAAHARLGRVRTVSESGNGPVTESPVAAKSLATTPVEPGTVKTEADLTVTFDLV